jgi:membrane fusion protein (multidrug efflux system)
LGARLAAAGAAGAAVASLAAAACGGGQAQEGGGGRGSGGQAGGGRGGPTAVEVAVVVPRTVTETREVTGTLAPQREARLLAQLEGAVIRVRVEEGDRVAAGALLAEFDPTVQEAELSAARTRARTARLAADRAARLLALGAASRAEQESALAALRDAEGSSPRRARGSPTRRCEARSRAW